MSAARRQGCPKESRRAEAPRKRGLLPHSVVARNGNLRPPSSPRRKWAFGDGQAWFYRGLAICFRCRPYGTHHPGCDSTYRQSWRLSMEGPGRGTVPFSPSENRGSSWGAGPERDRAGQALVPCSVVMGSVCGACVSLWARILSGPVCIYEFAKTGLATFVLTTPAVLPPRASPRSQKR